MHVDVDRKDDLQKVSGSPITIRVVNYQTSSITSTLIFFQQGAQSNSYMGRNPCAFQDKIIRFWPKNMGWIVLLLQAFVSEANHSNGQWLLYSEPHGGKRSGIQVSSTDDHSPDNFQGTNAQNHAFLSQHSLARQFDLSRRLAFLETAFGHTDGTTFTQFHLLFNIGVGTGTMVRDRNACEGAGAKVVATVG